LIFPQHLKEKFLPIVINRTVIFFAVMCVLTMCLYAAGTVQGFVDSTQFALLRLYFALGIFLAASSICGLCLNVGRFLHLKKKRYLARSAGYLLLSAFGVFTVLAVMFILAMSEGNILV